MNLESHPLEAGGKQARPNPSRKSLPKQRKKPMGDVTAELYNLTTDLAEQTNLISKHPEIAERLKQQLLSFQDKMN